MEVPKRPQSSSSVIYIIMGVFFLVFIIILFVFTSSSSKGGGGGGGGGIVTPPPVVIVYTDPDELTITKVTDEKITFSKPLNFDVIDGRDRLRFELYSTTSTNKIAEKTINLPSTGTRDLKIPSSGFTYFSGFDGFMIASTTQYWIKFVFYENNAPTNQVSHIDTFTTPNDITFESTLVEVNLPNDATRGQLKWAWTDAGFELFYDKNVTVEYVTLSDIIPSLVPSNTTHIRLVGGNVNNRYFFYRISDGKLIDRDGRDISSSFNDIVGNVIKYGKLVYISLPQSP